MNIRRGIAALAVTTLALGSLAACGSDTAQDEETPESLSFWYYEEDDSGQTQAWKKAAELFEEETGVSINFERKSSTQMMQNSSQYLNSDDAPDIAESNRGNGSAGVLSTMGLLTDLGEYVEQYGWDEKVTGADATVAKYDENGIMGGDTWYGMTSYAEFQRVYYNEDMFAEYGIEIPTTFDEFEEACQKFVDAGVTPIAADAQEYGVLWLWWQLVSQKADDAFMEDWHMYKGDVDWDSGALTYATDTIADWVEKGFISTNATGMKAEDTTQAFIKGEYPIYQTGTWNQGRFVKQITDFEWTAAVLPESVFAEGCAGNLLVIPERSKHHDLAAKFIDYVLSEEVQNYLGNAGGIPVAANLDEITDEKSKAMIEEYSSFANNDKLSYYPDYAASSLTDAIPASLQELVNGTMSADETLQSIHEKYDSGVEEMGFAD
ncbi:ABC transporter substrate-binding protein [Bifidobacterium eulemuris]|uniref:Extracellular solute-binding protein n=1 Tax=Bifidobacterium eulemuris TaxID=1765219 RepID=A0A261FYR9_9BIFI|nr:extracellular solute-binding protein [Bifidobacterium eulemuris]OZG64344.1 sugar ABC transporter substrate-binding protein [Bifidobacterium eulemuris]QOL32455.1 extracellular solute-binding protein [Bifidobacterium eulemuris]